MRREVMWRPWEGPGVEHLRLDVRHDGAISADGLSIGVAEDQAFRVHYELLCDADWQIREARVAVMRPGAPQLALWTDGHGQWTAEGGQPAPALAGCLDIDLSVTAFTNTLPIRRLGLQPGQSAELAVAYIDLPALDVVAVRQRYTCLARGPEGSRYRYESLPYDRLPDGFIADLSVDPEGLVMDYPPLFHRVWTR